MASAAIIECEQFSLYCDIDQHEAHFSLISFKRILKNAPGNSDPSFFLFVAGGVAGLLNLFHPLPFGKGFEMVAIATSLAQNGTFANPLLVLPSGASALAPPLYPLVLALLMKVLPSQQAVLTVAAFGDVLANALAAALMPPVSRLFFGRNFPGIVAAVFWIPCAQLIPAWDVNWTVAALMLFVLYSGTRITTKWSIFSALLAGALASTVFLLNSMTLLILLPWLVYLLFCRASPPVPAGKFCGIVLIMMALTAFPWIMRNERLLGGFVVRTGFGLNVYFSNNDCSRTNLVEDLKSGCSAIYQPDFNLNEAHAFRDLGEVNYDRQRLAVALKWIQMHPHRFMQLTMARIVAFWLPRRVEDPWRVSVVWIATVLSLPGLAMMLRTHRRCGIFVLAVFAVYPLPYYVVVSAIRYRYPVLWLSLLPAGLFVDWLLRTAQKKWHGRLPFANPPTRQTARSAG